MSDLTLPGTLPKLLRRGSPVRLRLAPDVTIPGVWVAHGTVATRHGGVTTTFEIDDGDGLTLQDVSLDLTDPTARSHALHWLRQRGRPLLKEWSCGLIPEEISALHKLIDEGAPAGHAECAALQALCLKEAFLEGPSYAGPSRVYCTSCGDPLDPWVACDILPRWVCGACLARFSLSREPNWVRPVFTFIPRLGRAQRLDTVGRSAIGLRVYHPGYQVGRLCGWDVEEIFLLEEAIGATPLSEEEKAEERAEWPDGYPSDTGVVFEVFVDSDFHDRVRARFKEPEDEGHGLHYDVTNLWVLTPARESA